MKPLLIVNPASNGGRTRDLWDDLRRPIERALGPCEVAFTNRAGHATEVARASAGIFDRIVAIGGDGTFSEVAAGVLAAGGNASVGVIHQGTGGDFRRSLGIEHRLDRYLDPIARNEPRAVDAGVVEFTGRSGQAESRHFVNVISLGMGGMVDKYVAEGSRMLGGSATYLAASLKALANGAVGHLRCDVTLAGETSTVRLQTRILAVCNGRFFAGGMEVAPTAKLDDGVFDVIAMTGTGRVPLLRTMSAVYRGEHLSYAGVQHFRATSMSVTLENKAASDRFLLDVDGEFAGTAPLRVRLLPRALRVLA